MTAPPPDLRASQALAIHLVQKIRLQPALAVAIPPGSRGWQLMVEAAAGLLGEERDRMDAQWRKAIAEMLQSMDGGGVVVMSIGPVKAMLAAAKEAHEALETIDGGETPECAAIMDRLSSAITTLGASL